MKISRHAPSAIARARPVLDSRSAVPNTRCMKLLVVEDHEALGDMIAAHLSQRGFTVDRATTGAAALAAAAQGYDAMILDLGLPDRDGLDVLKQLRADPGWLTPVLILTARDRVDQRIAGLDAGADDYILKPFDTAELEARLRAVLRRPGLRLGGALTFADISYDPGGRAVSIGARSLDLTPREATLLEELLRSGDRIVVRDVLSDRLYGVDDDVSANAIEATVSRLRRKLTLLGSAVRIEATRGIGYRLRHAAGG